MNTLSWLIYAAEVSDRASDLFGFVSFIFGFFGAIGVVVVFAMWLDEDGPLKNGWGPFTALFFYFVIEATLIIGSVALPSKTTIYMIAASEAGEAVVQSPDAIEMMGDLKAIIKKRLKEELGERD